MHRIRDYIPRSQIQCQHNSRPRVSCALIRIESNGSTFISYWLDMALIERQGVFTAVVPNWTGRTRYGHEMWMVRIRARSIDVVDTCLTWIMVRNDLHALQSSRRFNAEHGRRQDTMQYWCECNWCAHGKRQLGMRGLAEHWLAVALNAMLIQAGRGRPRRWRLWAFGRLAIRWRLWAYGNVANRNEFLTIGDGLVWGIRSN